MKELKFRAWTGYKYYYDVIVFDNNHILELRDLDTNQYSCEKVVCIEQYTGLKDKNGKEIYENDVVQISGERASIVFDEKLASYMGCFSVKYRNQKVKTNDYIFAFCPDDIEVIGNIHENKELLNGDRED